MNPEGMKVIKKAISIAAVILTSTTVHATPAGAYRRPGTTELISVTNNGTRPSMADEEGRGWWAAGRSSAITPDGRLIAFSTQLPLVRRDTNGLTDVYVRDRVLGITELVSVNSDGEIAQPIPIPLLQDHVRLSITPDLTADGRFVTFASQAGNLAPTDLNLTWDVFVHDRLTGRTVMASVARDDRAPMRPPGVYESGPYSAIPSISDDGRLVAFTSLASELVRADTNQDADVFVRDLMARTTTRVSVATNGSQSAGSCHWVPAYACVYTTPASSISGNGRFVAFDHFAPDLVEGDSNRDSDVFVHDLKTRTTERVSVASDGTQAESHGDDARPWFNGSFLAFELTRGLETPGDVLSRDGRYVTFVSNGDNLIPNDVNGTTSGFVLGGEDVFVHDRKSGRTDRVSVTSTGGEIFGYPLHPSISATGLYVTFEWGQDGFNCGVGRACDQGKRINRVVVHDRRTGALYPTSATIGQRYKYEAEGQRYAGTTSSGAPVITPDGRFVSFWSNDQRLRHPHRWQPPEQNGGDIFLYDRGEALGIGGIGSEHPKMPSGSGERLPGTNGSGIRLVDSPTDAEGLAGHQGAEILGATLLYRPSLNDLFLTIDLDHIPGPRGGVAGLPAAGNPAIVYGARFELDDKTYEVRAHKGAGLPTFGLFECSLRACREISRVKGGYGTAGESVEISVPLELLRPMRGGVIDAVEAFSARGTYIIGPITPLDKLSSQRAKS